ncbi:MAG TPA: TlpA disulfide reductase family protein [Gemmatimonadota bacterium]|nr:TlpA disulfide reductase family protein [Gemmatimonadota bacterium]
MERDRNRSKRWKVATAVILVAAAGGGLLVAESVWVEKAGVEVGEHAPEFSAPDLDGELVSLADLEGEVVLLNIWATWCGPCRVEMPSIQATQERFKEQGFTVLAVSIDMGPRYRDKVVEFMAEHELNFPVLLDPAGGIMRRFRAVGVPETFVLDRQGRIVKRVIGATNWDSQANRVLIEQLLRM